MGSGKILLLKVECDFSLPQSYRPILLLNVDYKIMTMKLTAKLNKIIGSNIHSDQAGFNKNQQLRNNMCEPPHRPLARGNPTRDLAETPPTPPPPYMLLPAGPGLASHRTQTGQPVFLTDEELLLQLFQQFLGSLLGQPGSPKDKPPKLTRRKSVF